MAHNNEPVQPKLLGLIIAAVSLQTAESGETSTRVDVMTCDRHGRPWPDTTMFREHDTSLVAHAALMAYEWIWRPLVPAHPDASSSPKINGARTKSDRSNGRH